MLGGGGETIFLKNFWIFSDSRTDEFSYNNFSNSTIDQFKYSHFVCLPVYHINIMHVFQCVRGFARGGGETQLRGGRSQGSPPLLYQTLDTYVSAVCHFDLAHLSTLEVCYYAIITIAKKL